MADLTPVLLSDYGPSGASAAPPNPTYTMSISTGT